MRILVLGAGFGGLELTTRLADELGDAVDIVLIDKADGFVFGFSKLDVMFGRTTAEAVRHSYRDLVKPGVRFVQATIRSIDPVRRRVQTDAGAFGADVMVVALGADLDPAATPGLVEAGREFYTVDGAFASRDVLDSFGGGRVIVGVTSTPFKCPPAPSETALMLHDYLVERGLRGASQISLVMPLGTPIPPSPAASQALLAAFAEREISWYPERLVSGLDPQRRVAVLADGEEMPFDLFPWCARPPSARGRGRVRDVRRRMDPGQPPYPRNRLPRRLRGGRRDQRRHAQGGSLLRAAGICRGRSTDRPARTGRLGVDVRRQGNLLHRIRSRPGRPRRSHVSQWTAPERTVRRAVGTAAGRQG
jgi:sulfide:quinone oxidoreductase